MTQGKRQYKEMKFWNWGPTTIWHNIECVAFYFSKSLRPTSRPYTTLSPKTIPPLRRRSFRINNKKLVS